MPRSFGEIVQGVADEQRAKEAEEQDLLARRDAMVQARQQHHEDTDLLARRDAILNAQRSNREKQDGVTMPPDDLRTPVDLQMQPDDLRTQMPGQPLAILESGQNNGGGGAADDFVEVTGKSGEKFRIPRRALRDLGLEGVAK